MIINMTNPIKNETYWKKELQKVESLKAGNQDQYNMVKPLAISQYKELTRNSSLKYAVRDGEKLYQFTARLQLYMDLSLEKNKDIHIYAPKGAWYQHRNPAGCFCCEDQNMIHYMFNIFKIIEHTYPDITIQ